jgi:hypothetical protein
VYVIITLLVVVILMVAGWGKYHYKKTTLVSA